MHTGPGLNQGGLQESDCSVFFFIDILYNFDCCITDTPTNSLSQSNKLDASVVSKGQNAPVTDQDKLGRSVISKDRTGNRKVKLEMIYRSTL